MAENNDLWSDYWSKEGAGGEVFVDAAGGKHPQLSEFWHQFCAELPAGQTIADIGCGAGSVFRSFGEHAAKHSLIGLDTSARALELLNEEIPSARAFPMTDKQWPLEPASVDVLVSQFGIEYASHLGRAFDKALHCVKPGGRMQFICHIEGGHIDHIITPQLLGAEAAVETDFALSATMLVKTKVEGPEGAHTAATEAFKVVERRFVERMRQAPSGAHVHLYGGFRHMFENWDKYEPDDILKWLADMDNEMRMAVSRLGAMRGARLNENDMQAITEHYAKHGATVDYQKFYSSTAEAPIAWQIQVSR